jgi:NADH-quinone oxidoreductase subunit N
MSLHEVLVAMAPEHFLLLGILLLIAAEIGETLRYGTLAVALAATGAATAAAFWLAANGYAGAPFPDQFSVTPAGSAGKAIVLALGIPVLLMGRDDFAADHRFPVLVLSSLYGYCLLLSADSFLTLFLGIEIMSLPVYVLVLLGLKRAESAEAALKYLVLSGAASATLLMGVALLYGATGSVAIEAFARAFGAPGAMPLAALVLIVVAFFLKAAVVPFHAWAPDAYEGASIPVTAYMATVIKAGVLLAAVRLFATAPLSAAMVGLVVALPLVSIVWGNLAAMRQGSLRRMIAYSSIAHAGYLFYALLGDGPGRYQAILFYVLAYGLMNILALAAIPPAPDDAARDRLDHLKGLFHRDPFAAVMIGIAMLSLAGIPPFPGFVAKFLIFKNVMAAGYTLYAVLGLIGSYLGIYFYLRVIQFMFMSPQAAPVGEAPVSRAAIAASLLCLVPVIVVSVFPGWVIERL